MRRARGPAAVLAAALLLTGCAQSVDPIERLGKKAAQGVRPSGPAPDRSYRHWGLTEPLRRPPRPAARPLGLDPDGARGTLPRVLDRVPTGDPVVFLTYDDGAEQDPRFVDMVRELRLPVSMFLTDSIAGPGYDHFARLRRLGAGIQNHTLDHRALAGQPYAGQRAEICGQQDRLSARLGVRARLFRPPYGTYDRTTLRAAADCGISAVVLWRAALTPADLVYTSGDHRLRPGDIILVGPDESTGPTLRERTTRVLRRVQQRGLTVGRLEDYL
ncbi:Peptidoglycan/xylan/chitin deacetylase, PgdA/CDA1 family [Streptomyces sp. 1222.5]|uniref:polysaccharide deacetylase family protein n=1 Tax=unclassified Streptomyces TaxID=2593676 RepID=UPI0008955C79|nr:MULTISPECIES: polysaccharide deacetylase family protein [unclassified Streptomyces]PKW09524.1 peptidoglycan/xylan/chitin deacetylase (PgdA/CDA1 family) [Streptomyces sp. 5112.2]SEC32501.1 Peptidoglycan/xylan/chitin deacetylase, PgdA/CDA1 family [Streptomyces sp. 1222.5]SED59996.1 Peptidoglycan/xylan/chitin deacetylase, PgdA/CDA1 family [Streptomyces sp. 2231.1]